MKRLIAVLLFAAAGLLPSAAWALGDPSAVIASCEEKLAQRATVWELEYTPFAEREDVKQADGYYAVVAACDKAKMELFQAHDAKRAAAPKTKTSTRATGCQETVELIGGLMGLGVLEAPRRQHSRNYHYDDASWATDRISAKRALAAGLLKYHQCMGEPRAAFIRIYGLYSGRKLARYGSRSGLKIY